MSQSYYPIGALVRLNSGGPEMLVTDFDVKGARTHVSWKVDGTVFEEWYPTACVHKTHPMDFLR